MAADKAGCRGGEALYGCAEGHNSFVEGAGTDGLFLHVVCKGVHSLMPDLGRVLFDGGLAMSPLGIPPEV